MPLHFEKLIYPDRNSSTVYLNLLHDRQHPIRRSPKNICPAKPNLEELALKFDLPKLIADEFPRKLWLPFKTLIAVSGGADSVALLRGMANLIGDNASANVAVLHVNHGTRKEQAQTDATFVKEITKAHGLQFHLVELEPLANSSNHAPLSEELLRDRRYEAFTATAKKIGARYLVTGHHLDDQVETVLFRILRGTGMSGLKGIPKYRVVDDALTIVRPLLKVSREQIIEYLSSLDQNFRNDQTNRSNDYTRNFLRNEILPSLDQRFGDVAGAISRLSEQAKEIDALIESEATGLNAFILRQSETEIVIDRSQLANAPVPLIQRMLVNVWRKQNWPLQSMDAKWWQQLTRAFKNPSPSHTVQKLNLPGKISGELSQKSIRFSRPTPND